MEQRTWYVYLLECADSTIYCGIALDVQKRLAQHNGQLCGGAKYTRGRRPVKVLASVSCLTRGAACTLECHIKVLPKNKKLSYVLSLT